MGRGKLLAPRPSRPLHPAVWAAVAAPLVLLDTWLLGLPFLGLLTCLVLFVVMAVRLILALVHKRRAVLMRLTVSMSLFTLAVAAIFVLNGLDRQLGAERAFELARAIQRYHAERGTWPPDLQALVPGFLPAIPRASYRLDFAEFRYWPDPPSLLWVVWPPFGRQILELESGKVNGLD